MCWDLYEHRRQRCVLVHITELKIVTPLPGDQHWPPAPHLYKPNVLLPFLALNIEEESRQSQRCSRSLASLSHNASKPSGSKETPRWGAQTQQSPSVCSQGPVLLRMSGDGAWPGSAKPTLPGSRLPSSKAPTKAFFSVSTCEVHSKIKLIKIKPPWAGTHFFLACDHSQPVAERSRGWLAPESFSLHHLALSHRKPSCVGGILKISSAKGHEEPTAGGARAVCTRWALHYASWAEILVRGKPVCLLVFSSVSSEALLCWRTSKELGQPLE